MLHESSVSVVIPAYNCCETIADTIKSISQQTKYSLIKEIIVIDDGSIDSTYEILLKIQKKEKKLKVLRKENSGVSATRNLGIKCAKGEWIALCDADDIWLNNKLDIQSNILGKYDYIDFLGGNHLEDSQKILFKKLDSLTRINTTFLCFKVLPQTSTCIFKKDIFESIGGYDEMQSHAEDVGYFMKIAYYYNFYYSPEQVVVYGNGKKVGDSGLSSNLKKMHKGFLKNFSDEYKSHHINCFTYIIALIFENIKYCVRLLK